LGHAHRLLGGHAPGLCAAPKKLGAASFYLFGATDARGTPFAGSKTYRLRVPPNVPALQFWAVTVYDLELAAFIRDAATIELNSYQEMQRNAGGSLDLFFGPQAPAGREPNWIATAPGRPWFTIFRFYGPEPAIHDKSWTLPDIEEVK
jgi:hypothetical protein